MCLWKWFTINVWFWYAVFFHVNKLLVRSICELVDRLIPIYVGSVWIETGTCSFVQLRLHDQFIILNSQLHRLTPAILILALFSDDLVNLIIAIPTLAYNSWCYHIILYYPLSTNLFRSNKIVNTEGKHTFPYTKNPLTHIFFGFQRKTKT